MGVGKGNKRRVDDFAEEAGLPEEVCSTLLDKFRKISAARVVDGLIDREELRQSLNSSFSDCLFTALDANGDGKVNFREYLKFASACLTGSDEERVEIGFSLLADTGIVSKAVVSNALSALLTEWLPLSLSQAEIELIIASTFEKHASNEHFLSKEEFFKMARELKLTRWLKTDPLCLVKLKKRVTVTFCC